MTTETALPEADQAEASSATEAPPVVENMEAAPTEGETKPEPEKKEKTAEEREIARLRRRVDTLTKRVYQAQATTPERGLQQQPQQEYNQQRQDDSDSLTLSRKEIAELIEKQARQLAPTISQRDAEIEHKQAVYASLEKGFGKERFAELASDLDDAFGGLADKDGRPKPATDAIFESDAPKALIEYLADPDHADEAEAIGRMSAVQAGRAIAKLEVKLAAIPTKPQVSKAQAPIEPSRGKGAAPLEYSPTMTDKQYAEWRKRQRS